MTHADKIAWMAQWCAKHSIALALGGECGFGRACVGVLAHGTLYPDYQWFDEKTYERRDVNGDVWTPPDAYHKHPCVAVLGHGEAAEAQLYQWLKWFDEHHFTVESGYQKVDPALGEMAYILGKHQFARMVRQS